MTRALANQVQLALERVPLEPVAGGDYELLDLRLRRASGLTEIGLLGVGRHDAPADEGLPFLGADLVHDRLATLALGGVCRQENVARRKLARGRQVEAESLLCDLGQKLVRQCRQDAGAVAGVRLRAARAAMVHAAQQVIRIAHDLMAALALDVRDEPDAAAVVLELGPIKPLGFRQAVANRVTHDRNLLVRGCRPPGPEATGRRAKVPVVPRVLVMVLPSGRRQAPLS